MELNLLQLEQTLIEGRIQVAQRGEGTRRWSSSAVAPSSLSESRIGRRRARAEAPVARIGRVGVVLADSARNAPSPR